MNSAQAGIDYTLGFAKGLGEIVSIISDAKKGKGHVNPPRICGDLLEFLMYHDAFVLGKKADGILVGAMKEDVCAVPTITVEGNTATIAAAGSTIYYTTNGADPRYSVDAKTYTGPVALTAGDQLRAYAAAEGKFNSDVVKHDYTASA